MVQKKIIVFGGSFNPPTKAHYQIAQLAIEQINADRVLFVPVGNSYMKNDLIDGDLRLEMLDLITKDSGNMFVSDVEVHSDKHMTTIDTLNTLQSQYKDNLLYFLMGADNLSYFSTWNNSESILKQYKLLVLNREGYCVEDIVSNDSLLS